MIVWTIRDVVQVSILGLCLVAWAGVVLKHWVCDKLRLWRKRFS